MAKYRDIRLIGEGGNATVHECARDTDERRFAKKRLKPDANEETKRRFRREVRMLAKLDHPNIINVVATHLDEEPLWFVTPLYRMSLDDHLPTVLGDRSGICKIFDAVLDAVEYAHAEGVIHRDLKPGNILLNSDEEIVVSDFGLGRAPDLESTRLTRSGSWFGTPVYMAPEQYAVTKQADARSDIYSLGRVLFELMGGQITAAVQDTSAMDPAIAVIIERCTRHNAAARFQSVAELKNAWRLASGTENAGTDSERLAELSARLAAGDAADHETIAEVFAILFRHADDSDLLHNTLIALPAAVVANYASRALPRARAMFKRFTEHIESQSWPFSYTDKIGDACAGFHRHIADPEIRADLLVCIADLGVGHNRYHVMERAQEILKSNRAPAERIALAHRVRSAHPRVKEWLRENISSAHRDKLLDDALRENDEPAF